MRGSGTAATSQSSRQKTRTANDIVADGKVRRGGSIGFRLLVPVIAASIGLVAGAVVFVAMSVTAARDAERARVLAEGTAAAVRLVDEIEQEVAETNALRERGGKAGEQLLTAQRSRTNRAIANFLDASRAAVARSPELARPVEHVTGRLDPLAAARANALAPEVQLSGFHDAFEEISHHLLDLESAVAEQLSDQKLANLARSAAIVSEIKHLAAEQRDLLRAAFVRRELSRAELVTLAELNGDQQAKLSEFAHIAGDDARRRFGELFAGPDVNAAQAVRDAVLRRGDAASLTVDADVWYIAQSGAMRHLHTLVRELTRTLDAMAHGNQRDAQTRAVVAGAIAIIVIAGTLTGGTSLAVRTTGRLRRLRVAALTVARSELPEAVAQVTEADDPDTVRGLMGASHQRVSAMLDAGEDEVAEVSAALGVVHEQALRLAAEQALLRLEVSALFVALSRRGQSLVQRQLQLIDEFERYEQDPETLARLFMLDHLAARMRRNEENLLVLAGGEPGRRFDTPVVLTDIVRAAAAEIEEYARVDAPNAEDVWVGAHAVGDVVHVLAELLDNATSFSPPRSRVRVLVQRDRDGVTVSVVDAGIGMSDEQIAEANERLSRPGGLTSALVGTMGLLVVARLAARRGLRVVLARRPEGGTTAKMWLPEGVLVTAQPYTMSRLRVRPTAPVRAVVPALPATPPPPPPTAVQRAGVPALPAGPSGPAAPDPWVGSGLPAEPARSPAKPALPAVPPAVANAVTLSAAGLPVRSPGTHGITRSAATPAGGDSFLDPETVRARLASLAGGIAAARRRVEDPPGASHLEIWSEE
jgi:signal transduction histidine kinase